MSEDENTTENEEETSTERDNNNENKEEELSNVREADMQIAEGDIVVGEVENQEQVQIQEENIEDIPLEIENQDRDTTLDTVVIYLL